MDEKEIYAVFIGDRYASDTPFNEVVFFADSAEEARKLGNEYIRAWDLRNETVRRVRLMSQEEWQERKSNQNEYNGGGFQRFRKEVQNA